MVKNYLKIVGLVLAISLVLGATGCSSIVSIDDFEDLESQIEDLESQVDDLEDELKEFMNANQEQSEETTEDSKEEVSDEASDETAPEAPQEPEKKEEVDPSAFSESEVLEQIEITEYTYSDDYNNYVFLVLKNNSDFDITIYGEVVFRNDEESLVGTKSDEKRAFESGQEIILDFYSDVEFASYDYTLSIDLETYYDSIISLLESEVSLTDSKAIIAVTNNGDKPAEYVEYTVLFFSGDTLVDYDWGYCTDDDSEIKPGKTNYDEARTYVEFDSILLFLSGRANKE